MNDDFSIADEDGSVVGGEYDDPDSSERIGWGFAYVDGKRLSFALYYDEPALIKALGFELPASPEFGDGEDFIRWHVRTELAIADASETFARSLSPEVRVRVPVEFGGPTAGGPGGIEGEVIQVLLGDHPIERLGALIEIAGLGWLALKNGLAATLGSPVGIPDGYAVVLASRAVEEQFDIRVSQIVEVTELHPHNLDRMGTPEGYAVALRDDDWLYTIIVSFHGDILSVNRVELARLSRRSEEPLNDEAASQG